MTKLAQRSFFGQVKQILTNEFMLVALLMGFASGFPLLLIKSTLKTWLRDSGVDLETIGFFALAGLPYTLKFLWAPFLDHYQISILGRRRSWLFLSQLLLVFGFAGLAFCDPINNITSVGFFAIWIGFFSANQDIIIDAYRRETLKDNELGLGSSLYVYGYRFALWLTKTTPLLIAHNYSWQAAYLTMAAIMSLNIITTLFSKEPSIEGEKQKDIKSAVIKPLKEFFLRSKLTDAFLILGFILLYKFGDSYASVMTSPFYIDMGFSKETIGLVEGSVGFFSQIIGLLLGGIIIVWLGIHKSLWIFGFLQMISTAGFAILCGAKSTLIFSLVIGFENISSGMGTAAFVAYMASLTDKRYTATQYALLTSLMAVPMNIFGATSGTLVKSIGWFDFFVTCTLIAIPGLLLLLKIAPWDSANNSIQEKSS